MHIFDYIHFLKMHIYMMKHIEVYIDFAAN